MQSSTLEEFQKMLSSFLQEEKKIPVLLSLSPEEITQKIPLTIPSTQQPIENVLSLLNDVVLATPRTSGTQFYNQLFGGREEIATVADMLAALLNNSMYTYKVAGIQVLIENTLIQKLCSSIGFSKGGGMFTPGGSLSNMAAMMLARNQKNETIREKGFDGKKYIVYTSEESHYSITKSAGILGIGREQVRKIVVDTFGKMIPEELTLAIERDIRLGHIPFFVNATAGTTVLGAFDPFEPLGKIAKEYGLWFHIDGAWGGTVALHPKHKALLQGIDYADSFTWDMHKMMGVPLIASTLLVRNKTLLTSELNEQATYLFQGNEDELNPGTRSLQCGRRNDALKVWALWQYYGDQGLVERIEKQFALVHYAVSKINDDPTLSLVVRPELLNICFAVKDCEASAICELLDEQGKVKVGYGTFRNQTFIRLITVNPHLTTQDLDQFFEYVKDTARELTS